jgi:murein DD-endopeptidase MepM/ murein hydrolase activator NlpD
MRRVVPVLVALVAAGLAASALGAGGVPDPIVFPVVGPYRYTNDFGDPRPQGSHEGNDILAPKKSIVVAVEDGKIKFWTTSARAGCMLYLYGASGTTYLYIHLNNDVTMANDNRGKCVPGGSYWPGLKDGQRVVAGQAIGYVGDSGDADGTPHLHFEVHPNDGGPTN